jgi:hypothetical protein
MSSSSYTAEAFDNYSNIGEDCDDLYSSGVYRHLVEANRELMQRSRTIFSATNLKGRNQLTDREAFWLAHKLEWAQTWRKNSQTAISEDSLNDLEIQAKRLKSLMVSDQIKRIFDSPPQQATQIISFGG